MLTRISEKTDFSLQNINLINKTIFPPAKILILSLDEADSSRQVVEIIDLINPKFKSNWTNNTGIAPRFDAFGTILQDQAVICGGSNKNLEDVKDCMVIGNLRSSLTLLRDHL